MAHSVLISHPQMWKSVVGHNVSMKVAGEGDDWETDPDFEVLCTSWSERHCREGWVDTPASIISDFVFMCVCVLE